MRSFTAAFCLLSALLLPACGDSDAGRAPSALVPEDSAVYATITLDPEGDLERAVHDVAARFPGGDELDAQIENALAEAFREEGLDYAKDVKPWLGDEAVVFVSDVDEGDADAAAVVQVTDEDAAREAIEKGGDGKSPHRSYEGARYLVRDDVAYGVVEGNAVIGTEGGFRDAVDTAAGESSIEDADRVAEAFERLPDETLARLYFDGRKLLGALGPEAALIAPFIEIFDEPYVVGLSAEPDAVVFDAALPAQAGALVALNLSGSGADLVEEMPADSFYAAGQSQLGKSIQSVVRLVAGAVGGEQKIEQQVRATTGLDLDDDILSWMGDFGLFARGTSVKELEAGAVIETTDPELSRRTVETLGRVARREAAPGVTIGELTLAGGGDGFTVNAPELPAPLHVVQRGERVVLALGDQAAQDLLEPSHTLAGEAGFRDAAERLGERFQVSNYVDVPAVIELAENEGAGSDPGYLKAKPYLEAFSRMVVGTKEEDDDILLSRTRVEFR